MASPPDHLPSYKLLLEAELFNNKTTNLDSTNIVKASQSTRIHEAWLERCSEQRPERSILSPA